MNIKTRIHKLEASLQIGGTFCACPNVNKTELWLADLGEESGTSEPHLEGAAVPDFCLICRKPIEKRKLIFQLCDHTTKDRFPEEWNAARENRK